MKTRRIQWLCVALPALAWLAYLLGSDWLARSVDAHWGQKILAATDGNVPYPKTFVQGRMLDAVFLFSVIGVLMLIHIRLASLCLKPDASATWRWVFHSLAGFVAVNLWLAAACQTTLFWALFWQGRTDTAALARFQLKNHLLAEAPAWYTAAILGNSQARAQLDEKQLSQSGHVTVEAHYPGARAFDLWLVHRHLANTGVIICYVSEMTFYDPVASEATPHLFSFTDVTEARRLGAFQQIPARKIGYGLLGDALPAFYLRDPLAQRILGTGVSSIRQRQHDQGIKTAQTGVIDAGSTNFHLGTLSDFQKRAFEAFVADCASSSNQTLVIIAGQLNPRLSAHINPAVREDMLAFLRGLRQHAGRVVLIDDCPAQAESEYEDLTHVNPETQEIFTRFIAGKLRNILRDPERPD